MKGGVTVESGAIALFRGWIRKFYPASRAVMRISASLLEIGLARGEDAFVLRIVPGVAHPAGRSQSGRTLSSCGRAKVRSVP